MKYLKHLLLVALLAVTPASGDFVVLQGLQHQLFSLSLKIQKSLIPEIARGSGTPTYARATIATGQDFEGLNKRLLSGEPRFLGARRVENLNFASEDLTDGSFDVLNNAVVTNATTATYDGTVNGAIRNNLAIIDDGSGALGRTFVFSVKVKLVSGTISSDAALNLFAAGDALTTITTDIGSEVTTTAQRFTVTASTDAAGTGVKLQVVWDDAGVLELTEWQTEEVTGQTNQNPSEYVSSGVLSSPFHGAGIDSVRFYKTHNANTVSSGIVTEAVGALINSSNSQYAELDGETGSHITSPDSAAHPTGDIDIRVRMAFTDWTPATIEYFYSKWDSSDTTRSINAAIKADGLVQLEWTSDGTNGTKITKTSTLATGLSDGTVHWLRITLDVDNDAAGNDVKYYTSDENVLDSDDVVTWTQLGSTVTTAGTTSIFDGTAVYEIGAINSAGSFPVTGKLYRAQIYDGIDGTLAVDYDANDYDTGLTQTSSATSEVWTYNGNASVFSPYSRWVDVDGTSDGWTSPDTAGASITGDIILAGWGAPDDWTPSARGHISGKFENTDDNRSYGLGIGPTGVIVLVTSFDGTVGTVTTTTSDVATGFEDGTLHGFAVSLDISENIAKYYTTTDSPRTPPNQVNWVQLGSDVTHTVSGIFDSTALITIGGIEDGIQTQEWVGRIMRTYAIAGLDFTAAPAWDFDPRAHVSGTAMIMATGEVWTAVGNGTVEGGRNGVAQWDVDGPYGYLPEQAGDNDLLQSEALNVTWSNALNSIDAQNTVVAIDGRLTGNTITDDGGGGTGVVAMLQGLTVASGNNTFSAYLKKDQLDWGYLRAQDYDTLSFAFFDLTRGLVGNITGATDAGIRSVGNGWYRCWIVFNTTSDLIGNLLVEVAEADNDNTVTLDGTSSIHWFGGMLNPGTFPHSYVPTTTSAVTRNKDDDTFAGAGNASYPLTARLEYTPTQITQIGVLLDINDGTADERVEISVTAAGKPRLLVRAGASDVASITADDALIVGVAYSITAVVGVDDARLYVNSRETGTADTSMALPATPSSIDVGQDYNAANQPFGEVSSVTIAPSPWSASRIAQ